MRAGIAVVAAWLMASAPGHAAVEAVLFHITTNEWYTVPAGKTLIFENIVGLAEDHRGLEFGNGANKLRVSYWHFTDMEKGILAYWLPLTLPLKVPQDWTIRGYFDGDEWDEPPDIWVFGLLVDASDLYASLQNTIDQIRVQGNAVTLGLQTRTSRPARISVEKSARVDGGWQPAATAASSPDGDKTRYVATVPVQRDRQFFRARAVPLNR